MVDFTASDFTKPFKTGNQLPATCSPGEFFFNTQGGIEALFACVSANSWSQETTSGAVSTGISSSALADFNVTRNSSTLTVGAGCSALSPCNVRLGSTIYQVQSPGIATLTGGTGSGVANIYLSDAGVLVMEYSQTAAVTVQTSGIFASALTTPSFPANTIPIAQVAISSGAWGTVADMRSFLSGTSLVGGTGIVLNQTSGRWQVDIDPALVPTFNGLSVFTGNVVASTAAQTAPNKAGVSDPLICDPSVSETFFNTTSNLLKVCTATNTWSAMGAMPSTSVLTNQSNIFTSGTQDFSGAAHTLPSAKGLTANMPVTCTVGEEYFATDAVAGQNKYYCTSSNIWTQQKGSSGSGAGGANIFQGTYANLPGNCSSGDLYLFTDALFPFARCGATGTWAKFYQGKVITPAADMALTQSLQSGVTANLAHGYESLKFSANGPSTASVSYWSAPAAPYTQSIYVRLPVQMDNANYRLFSVGFMDQTGVLGSLRCGVGSDTASGTWCDIFFTGNSTGEAKFSRLSAFGTTLQGDVCFVLQDDGSALHWGISFDGGDTSSEFYSEPRTAHFASGPSRMFIGGMDTAPTYPQTVTFLGTR
jgi:hypothetical protein